MGKDFDSLRDVLASLGTAEGLPFDLRDCQIWRVWDEVVGEPIGSNARPVHIRQGSLTVGVREPIWLQELKYQGDIIRQKLNERLGREAVRTIRFKLLNGRIR